MKNDILQNMDHTALGTRLRRAGLGMQAVSEAWLKAQGCDMPSAQMPVLAALSRGGSATTGQLSDMLGTAQPGVSRMLDQMQAAGWTKAITDTEDRRVRRNQLTAKGEALAAQAEQDFWPVIDAAVEDLCADLEGPFLAQLTALEDKLRAGALEAALKRQMEDAS